MAKWLRCRTVISLLSITIRYTQGGGGQYMLKIVAHKETEYETVPISSHTVHMITCMNHVQRGWWIN